MQGRWIGRWASVASLWLAATAGVHAAPHPPLHRELPRDLGLIILPITSEWEFEDGHIERSFGTGFVVGTHYYTVAHNVWPEHGAWPLRMRTFIDGHSTGEANALDRSEDVAIFELDGTLCERHCNDLALADLPDLTSAQPMMWLRQFQGEVQWKRATVTSAVFRDYDPDASACAGNMVVQVNQPFVGGSSGSPVLDARSGRIAGIIQGSFRREDGDTVGYFKPIHCVLARHSTQG